MNLNKNIILGLLSLVLLFPSSSMSAEYALASALYSNEECTVVTKSRSDKIIIYKGEPYKKLCSVYVPNAVFEKDFKYCVLSGIKINSRIQPVTAVFGGGPAVGREKYWFEWSNAKDVISYFYCFFK